MNISNIISNVDMFSSKEGIIGGDVCLLIKPNNITCKWTEDTLQFRSLIVRKSDYKVISRGFPKFFNWSEQPDLNKFPDGPFDVLQKMDGSLIIWGIYNDEYIHRTRGTFNLITMPNGGELEFLKSKYPNLLGGIKRNPEYSILTEWETKTNVIVINRVSEPTLTLIGMIHNESGILKTQQELDELAQTFGLERPTRYEYNSISECISDVELWNGMEGVVMYSEDGQHLRKCKSEWYLALHKIRTGFTSIKHVLDVFIESPKFMNSDDFYNYIVQVIDFEVAEKIKSEINTVVQAYCNYKHKLNRLVDVVNDLSYCDSRKEQALVITTRYDDWRTGHAFLMLDNREITDKILSNAVFQELEDLTNKNKYETNTSNL